MDPRQARHLLGLDADETYQEADVKKAFRSKALECHPDRLTAGGVDPAAQFKNLQQATAVLLQRRVSLAEATGAAAGLHRTLHAERAEAVFRSPRFTRYFIAASLACGCAIFVGALSVHRDLYSHGIQQELDQRREMPSQQQARIVELLQQRRAGAALDRPRPPGGPGA